MKKFYIVVFLINSLFYVFIVTGYMFLFEYSIFKMVTSFMLYFIFFSVLSFMMVLMDYYLGWSYVSEKYYSYLNYFYVKGCVVKEVVSSTLESFMVLLLANLAKLVCKVLNYLSNVLVFIFLLELLMFFVSCCVIILVLELIIGIFILIISGLFNLLSGLFSTLLSLLLYIKNSWLVKKVYEVVFAGMVPSLSAFMIKNSFHLDWANLKMFCKSFYTVDVNTNLFVVILNVVILSMFMLIVFPIVIMLYLDLVGYSLAFLLTSISSLIKKYIVNKAILFFIYSMYSYFLVPILYFSGIIVLTPIGFILMGFVTAVISNYQCLVAISHKLSYYYSSYLIFSSFIFNTCISCTPNCLLDSWKHDNKVFDYGDLFLSNDCSNSWKNFKVGIVVGLVFLLICILIKFILWFIIFISFFF